MIVQLIFIYKEEVYIENIILNFSNNLFVKMIWNT